MRTSNSAVAREGCGAGCAAHAVVVIAVVGARPGAYGPSDVVSQGAYFMGAEPQQLGPAQRYHAMPAEPCPCGCSRVRRSQAKSDSLIRRSIAAGNRASIGASSWARLSRAMPARSAGPAVDRPAIRVTPSCGRAPALPRPAVSSIAGGLHLCPPVNHRTHSSGKNLLAKKIKGRQQDRGPAGVLVGSVARATVQDRNMRPMRWTA